MKNARFILFEQENEYKDLTYCENELHLARKAVVFSLRFYKQEMIRYIFIISIKEGNIIMDYFFSKAHYFDCICLATVGRSL